ncbi:Calcium-activated potassium channel subunit beta-2 [Acipenser ruthenus]|uniref:Calcium-activated potassium channel subunit beta-2 n=1 Tax=Acipenser ruthenus TaxID=7906 RepID=A0A444TZ91_ACIRT|nr:Calcium-activated potassium channel subunit beta-2 [Acipenser ruthenus]
MQREESYIGFYRRKKKVGSFAHQTQSSAVRSGEGGKFSKMFLWTGSRAAQGSQYERSVWTEESWCTVLNSSNIGDMTCTFSCGSDCYEVSKYPCLQVFVILNSSGEVYRLSHTEETLEINPECFYVPKCKKTCNMTVIESIAEHFKRHQQFPCFHDRERKQENVLLTRLYGPSTLFHSLFWPTCMAVGGTLIIAMVKLTQYLSLLCESISKIKR